MLRLISPACPALSGCEYVGVVTPRADKFRGSPLEKFGRSLGLTISWDSADV